MGCMGEILLHSHSFGVLQPAYLKSLEKTLGHFGTNALTRDF